MEFLYLNLIRLEQDDTNSDGPVWKVTFEASTENLDRAELTVEVDAETPEEALRSGRNAMETALKELKQVAARWER